MPAGSRTIWKRRAVLMAAVGLLAAVPLTLIVRGAGDEGESGTGVGAPELGEVKSDRKLGINVRLPAGWKRKRKDGSLTLRDADGGAVVAISSPGPAEDADEIHEAAVAAVKSDYRRVSVEGQTRKLKLGGRRAITAVLSARHPKKDGSLRVLVATARGKRKAYLVEVVTSETGAGSALVEAQALLNRLRLKR